MTNSETYKALTVVQLNDLFKHFRGGWDDSAVVELVANSSDLFDAFSTKKLQDLVRYMRNHKI